MTTSILFSDDMSIEIKQLTIKSTVISGQPAAYSESCAVIDEEQLKEMILAECREYIQEALAEQQER